MEEKLGFMGDAAVEAVNNGDMDLAMFTVAVGAVSMLAEIAKELRLARKSLEFIAEYGLGGDGT